MKVSILTGTGNWFEDFTVGQRLRHARAATVDEVENNYISKQVMNTAQAHWNAEVMTGSPLGDGRLVFGLITGSMTVGLTSQDTAENVLAEVGLDKVRFTSPVHHGDTITAFTEVLAVDDVPDHDDAGLVRFKHWGRNQHGQIVCELERIVLIKRRSHWGRSMTAPDHTAAHHVGAPMRTERSGPLSDVRIVDLTQALAGPYCTMILADMGADVIKVEPPAGDGPRFIGPHTEADADHHFGGYFASINRNKRSVVLDLKEAADREQLLRLIDTADVLVENYRVGVMDRLGLSFEAIHARRPQLVYAAIRGFGDPRTGASPYTNWPAYDIIAQSMGGLISYTGTLDGHRVASGPSVGDLYPATMCAVGVLGALHHARATGVGQFVDVGMMDSVIALCESMIWRYSYTGEVQAPRGTEHPSLCPFEIYRTADGACAIVAPGPKHWADLCTVIGRQDLIDTAETSSARRRVDHRGLVRDAIEQWTGARSTQAVVDALAGKVPVGPVNNAPMLIDDPHVRARQMLVAIEHPGSTRPVLTPNTPIRFATTPGGVYRRAPMLGEHTDEVLAELHNLDDTGGAR